MFEKMPREFPQKYPEELFDASVRATHAVLESQASCRQMNEKEHPEKAVSELTTDDCVSSTLTRTQQVEMQSQRTLVAERHMRPSSQPQTAEDVHV